MGELSTEERQKASREMVGIPAYGRLSFKELLGFLERTRGRSFPECEEWDPRYIIQRQKGDDTPIILVQWRDVYGRFSDCRAPSPTFSRLLRATRCRLRPLPQ